MDPGEILRGHHISNFEKEITRDNRLITIVKQVVENSSRDMAMSIIKSKLNKKHGGEVYINFAECAEKKILSFRR